MLWVKRIQNSSSLCSFFWILYKLIYVFHKFSLSIWKLTGHRIIQRTKQFRPVENGRITQFLKLQMNPFVLELAVNPNEFKEHITICLNSLNYNQTWKSWFYSKCLYFSLSTTHLKIFSSFVIFWLICF